MKEELRALIVALEDRTYNAPEDSDETPLVAGLLDRAKALDALSEEDLTELVGIAHKAVADAADEGNELAQIAAGLLG